MAIQDLPERYRVLGASLARQIEVARVQDPDSRHLPFGQTGKRREGTSSRCERHHRSINSVCLLSGEDVGELLGSLRAAQAVRMRAQVGRAHQDRSYQLKIFFTRRTDKYPDVPQASFAVDI